MSEQDPQPRDRFARAGRRHRFTAREVHVAETARPVDAFIRVTFSGPELHDFVSTGPGDHVRLFFPHPITGELVAPAPAGPGEDGIVRPEAPMFARDFTPLNVRVDPESDGTLVDVDFLRHPDPGPASAWAEAAAAGDRLVAVGPRGSRGVPAAADRILCVADASALPSAARWIAQAPEGTTVEVLADLHPADLDWADAYLRELSGRAAEVYEVFGDLGGAVRDFGVDEGTFVVASGEAGRLIPLRKLLKYELGLPREQYAISGYWKRGMVAFDHHAPIDPADPDD
ncbi:siderophore-interacting protein [Leucobacter sp. CSA1]|uniref:Siderophore-interacting protein n=1 Tax=Leucobacter chromiisoli TaxID=2796471 RepID=A0A934Q7V6_9MICO|nr:siderophore-interacting protein [Leucobacter chromiisoli]MBK0418711.1 siderophore-interacting protein [Leucobacter chromiisoli]